MRKVIFLILSVFILISCNIRYSSVPELTDLGIVEKVEKNDVKYHLWQYEFKYKVKFSSLDKKKIEVGECILYTNTNYKVGDTIRIR